MKQMFFAATVLLAASGTGFAADFNTAFSQDATVDAPQGLLAGGILNI